MFCCRSHAGGIYDMEADSTELHNLAGTHPKLEADLKGQYVSLACQTWVLGWDIALPKLLAAWKIEIAGG